MKIAVISITRDRLDYSKVCFASLHENAGVPFDHYIFDNGSADGTVEWLRREYSLQHAGCIYRPVNVGIHRAMNDWLHALKDMDYDLVVRVDNDCQIVTPGTLKAVAEHVLEKPEQPRVVSPLILGLRNRPSIQQIRETPQGPLALTRQVGGIFLAIPPSFLKAGFRFHEDAPIWGGDDELVCAKAHEQNGYTGYLLQYEAWHYLGTEGQVADKPEYFARRVREGGPAK